VGRAQPTLSIKGQRSAAPKTRKRSGIVFPATAVSENARFVVGWRHDPSGIRERRSPSCADATASSASICSALPTGEGSDPEASDLDFVVSFERREPQDLFGRYFGLEQDLEALFRREVDHVMEGALGKSRRFAQNVEASRISLCGA
jgi:predicted nucleotidyltransferase